MEAGRLTVQYTRIIHGIVYKSSGTRLMGRANCKILPVSCVMCPPPETQHDIPE